MTHLFYLLEHFNNFLWSNIAFLIIIGVGGYFCISSGFFQIRKAWPILRSFFGFFEEKSTDQRGIHPLKAFFAAIGGCIGIGNVVGICTAVQIGGPGAMFWAWVAGLCGMLIQYTEVYLGLKYRVKNSEHNYDGGPMYFLPIAYKTKWVAPLVSFLLCIYGVEIFMFNVMADSLSVNWHLNIYAVVAFLLIATIVVALGGIKRVGEVCSAIIPLFILIYCGMCLWVLILHAEQLPRVFYEIFEGAFTAQAAQGIFAGSTVALTISMGLSRGAYSGDWGIGYTSIIYAESQSKHIRRLAALTIVGTFLDTFIICSLSILVVLVTGQWKQEPDVSLMVQDALATYFPYMNYFMPFFLFLLGYTTILAYFVVGVKCAKFLSPKWGPFTYYLYAIIALPLFAFTTAADAFVVMSIAGACLLILNLIGMFLLRKEVQFGLEEHRIK